jgi:hypothetical protein
MCFWNQQDNECGYSARGEEGSAPPDLGSVAEPTGCEIRILVSNLQHEKLLDDTGQLLYCDPKFDR